MHVFDDQRIVEPAALIGLRGLESLTVTNTVPSNW